MWNPLVKLAPLPSWVARGASPPDFWSGQQRPSQLPGTRRSSWGGRCLPQRQGNLEVGQSVRVGGTHDLLQV